MSLLIVGVSHKTAPVCIRELFAFTHKKQVEILENIKLREIVEECVLVSTCNRTEFYLYSSKNSINEMLEDVIDYISSEVIVDFKSNNCFNYLKFYSDKEAVNHLFNVTAGLDSMVIGEDQILGQIKEAFEVARYVKCIGKYMNTLFRFAITASKKVKSETELSKTSISTATLSVKACIEYLNGLSNKNVLVIGATGKFGNIVVKNLLSFNNVNVYVTIRNHSSTMKCDFEGVVYIDYNDRYKYLDKMDAVISTTSSPHYTLKSERITNSLIESKKRIFIDLAVPKDIEYNGDELFYYMDIDDFNSMAKKNNEKKLLAIKKVEPILQAYKNEFFNWQIYNDNKEFLNDLRVILNEKFKDEQASKVMNYIIYHVRDNVLPDNFDKFLDCIKSGFQEDVVKEVIKNEW